MTSQTILLSAFGALHHRLTNFTGSTIALVTKTQYSRYFEHILGPPEGIQLVNLHVEHESFTQLVAQERGPLAKESFADLRS